jgi:hypothetical protein
MLVYHGSNTEIIKPEIRKRRTMDFGYGFYTTMNKKQAVEFAPKVVLREQKLHNDVGMATVNVYEFDKDLAVRSVSINALKIKSLYNQVVFKTDTALRYLIFQSSY